MDGTGNMIRKYFGVLIIILLFALGYVGTSAIRHFVWDNYKRYEIFPLLIPKPERIATSLFKESICQRDSLPTEGGKLLKQAGYFSPPTEPGEYDTLADFLKPLHLSVPEYGINNWAVLSYFSEGSSGGISGIEVNQPLPVVAKTLGVPANERQFPLTIRTESYVMVGDRGIQLTATRSGTKIGCWFLDG
jgi:hypothetical protein